MVYIAKKCIGCQSNKRMYGVTYNDCKANIGRRHKDYKIFREQYCPCVECLVKATCTEPKVSGLHYSVEVAERHDKCKVLSDQIDKFRWSK